MYQFFRRWLAWGLSPNDRKEGMSWQPPTHPVPTYILPGQFGLNTINLRQSKSIVPLCWIFSCIFDNSKFVRLFKYHCRIIQNKNFNLAMKHKYKAIYSTLFKFISIPLHNRKIQVILTEKYKFLKEIKILIHRTLENPNDI